MARMSVARAALAVLLCSCVLLGVPVAGVEAEKAAKSAAHGAAKAHAGEKFAPYPVGLGVPYGQEAQVGAIGVGQIPAYASVLNSPYGVRPGVVGPHAPGGQPFAPATLPPVDPYRSTMYNPGAQVFPAGPVSDGVELGFMLGSSAAHP